MKSKLSQENVNQMLKQWGETKLGTGLWVKDPNMYEIQLKGNKMTEERFEEIVEDTLAQIKETILVKGKEYRRNKDPFHNFNQGAKLTGNTKYEVLDGFKLKHDISIQDIVNDYKKMTPSSESIINEKMNDILIYTIVKKAMMIEDTISFHKVTRK